jgi:uncharacterized protein (DUF1810 family)
MNNFNLDRFVTAQNIGGDYEQAAAELRRGRKTSHWMWYIFPQVEGLGYSAMSQRYAISSLAEAQAYLAHPVLGPRLTEVSRILLELETRSATAVFGGIDAQKLRSSMTLFDRAASAGSSNAEPSVFRQVLDSYFDGESDEATLARL